MNANKVNYGAQHTLTLTTTLLSTTTADEAGGILRTDGYHTANITNQMTTCSNTSVSVYADVSCDGGVTYGQIATINVIHVTTAASTVATNESITSLGTHLRIRYAMRTAGAVTTLRAVSHIVLKTDK